MFRKGGAHEGPAPGKDSGKWCLTFISHNRGCQYYIGTYDRKNDEFLPERHGRMSWVDSCYFAPEALIDGKNRYLLWTWLRGNVGQRGAYGWYGVYGMPIRRLNSKATRLRISVLSP